MTAATIFHYPPTTDREGVSKFPGRSDKNAICRIGRGTSGRIVGAISTEGGIFANTIPGNPQMRWNQVLGLIDSAVFPFSASMTISRAIIGETRNGLVRTSLNTLFADSRKRLPFMIPITAQVSSRKPNTLGYRAISHSSPAGEVRSVPIVMVTVPLSAPKIFK